MRLRLHGRQPAAQDLPLPEQLWSVCRFRAEAEVWRCGQLQNVRAAFRIIPSGQLLGAGQGYAGN